MLATLTADRSILSTITTPCPSRGGPSGKTTQQPHSKGSVAATPTKFTAPNPFAAQQHRNFRFWTTGRNSVVGTYATNAGGVLETAEYSLQGRLTTFDHDPTLGPSCIEDGTNVCPNPSNIPFGFNSAMRSPRSGLIYMRNRWYSAQTAQFVSHDPLGYVDSHDPYAFAKFDPVNYWDPFGLEACGPGDAECQEEPEEEPEEEPFVDPCNQPGGGCFAMPPGTGRDIFRFGKALDELADDRGDTSKRATDNARDHHQREWQRCESLLGASQQTLDAMQRKCLGFWLHRTVMT